MADVVLDTSAFIEFWRGVPTAQRLLGDVVKGVLAAAVSPMTAVELWQFPGFDRREELQYLALMSLCEEIPLDIAIGIEVGKAMRPLGRNQRRTLLGDAIIAMTASALGVPVVSHNTRDMRRFYPLVQTY